MNYKKFMLQAINDANKYKYTAKPNPVVGAILLKEESIISSGYHEQYGCNHAEINAIENAKKNIGKMFKDFSELTLICSLEPCSHVGKTGSCAHKIVESGIKNVIVGSIDPNPKVSGKGIKILKDNDVSVTSGILDELVEQQNKSFFFKHRNKRPYITVKIASSKDGKSHYPNISQTVITCKESKKDVQIVRANHDAILTGGNTLRNDNPRMNARVHFSLNQPKKILLTNKSFDSTHNYFQDNNVDIHKTKNLDKIIKSYYRDEITSILVEAGPKLVNSFLKANLVDELIVYRSNIELGGDGVDWFEDNNAIEKYDFKLESSCRIDNDIKEIYKK